MAHRQCAPAVGAATALLALGAVLTGAHAQSRRLRVTFQPDCFRAAGAASPCDPIRGRARIDLGPQIAIWLESADGASFVDTILVTNLTAVFGIGNRVGYWALPSGPKFPYGKRVMALPVWAHRRGKLYDTLVNQSGVDKEYSLGGLEPFSSPDPYFCRPLEPAEIVDAITCPTATFDSSKGRFFDPALDLAPMHRGPGGAPRPYVPPPRSYYPPRNELRNFTMGDCDDASERPDCPIAARRFAELNDLDAVAAATPQYGRPHTKTWTVPDDLPDGDYALLLEISKEFDTNASHAHPARPDHLLEGFGLTTNLGQPSVVFRVEIRLSRAFTSHAAVTAIAGYGDWNGATGTLHAPDRSISDAPGSGAGRLLAIPAAERPTVIGRVHVAAGPLEAAPAPDAGGAPDGGPPDGGASGPRCSELLPVTVPAVTVPPDALAAERAEVRFVEPDGDAWRRLSEYELRYWNDFQQGEDAFRQGTPVEIVPRRGPGESIRVVIPNLKALSTYTIGVRPLGVCVAGRITFARFTTSKREFTKLSGCFIATAAWGASAWSVEDLAVLRRSRDWLRDRSPLAAVLAEAYARSSPPLASLLATDSAARAVVRRALRPFVSLLRR